MLQATTLSPLVCRTYEEDLSVTFQIGLVGCDGLVVGSDRRVLYRSPSPDLVGPNPAGCQSFPSTKFVKAQDESLVCACAGGPQSRSVATAVVADWPHCLGLSTAAWEDKLRITAESVQGNSVGDEIIIVRKDHPSRILVLNRNNRVAGIQPVETNICTGTATNARFLPIALWQPSTVSNLRWLALLTLGYAAKERPTEVGDGFDLMTLHSSSSTITWERFEPNDPAIVDLVREFSALGREFLSR